MSVGALVGARMRTLLAALTPVVALAFLAASAQAAGAVAISPLNGTPDASPDAQISFLGVPASEIKDVSVVGTRSGSHSGKLEAYATAPGASFLPKVGFTQGEQVTASAVVGSAGHTERVSTRFTVARLPSYKIPAAKPFSLPAKPGTVQSFVSEPSVQPPTITVTTSAAGTSPGDIFLTPSHGFGQTGAMIIDGQGRLVWFHSVPKGDDATDFQVESYRGQPVLVWWQGEVPATLGVGFGTDEIYSSSYKPIATVSAGNGYRADLHEMQLTPSGSAFVTAYTLVDANLSSVGGPSDGILQDAVLQEIDVPTGLVMFEWHADGHVAFDDSYSPAPSSHPWDYFHLNSVSLDPTGDGNFIVSSRNTWAAYEINHDTGAWQPDHTLTLFDDGATPKEHSQSRAIRLSIDWKTNSVSLVGRDVHAPGLLTGSQGNDQVLADGNSLVGWGELPYVSEFSPSGQMIFDAHFPSPGQSYRAFRFPWSATPAAPPSVAVKSTGAGTETVYASWNGATDVSAWRVLAGANPTALATIATAPVGGFETAIPVSSSAPDFAVQALGPAGEVLGSSAAVSG